MPTPLTLTNQTFDTVITQGEDSLVYEFGTQQSPVLISNCQFKGGSAEWALKNSGGVNASIIGCILSGGKERAYDQVNGGNVTFANCIWQSDPNRKPTPSRFCLAKECDIGVKGAAHDMTFQDCVFQDILLGDYSIYNEIDGPTNAQVANIKFINCKRPDGGPIIVRGIHVKWETVTFENTPASKLEVPGIAVDLYWWYNRKFGDKRTAPKAA